MSKKSLKFSLWSAAAAIATATAIVVPVVSSTVKNNKNNNDSLGIDRGQIEDIIKNDINSSDKLDNLVNGNNNETIKDLIDGLLPENSSYVIDNANLKYSDNKYQLESSYVLVNLYVEFHSKNDESKKLNQTFDNLQTGVGIVKFNQEKFETELEKIPAGNLTNLLDNTHIKETIIGFDCGFTNENLNIAIPTLVNPVLKQYTLKFEFDLTNQFVFNHENSIDNGVPPNFDGVIYDDGCVVNDGQLWDLSSLETPIWKAINKVINTTWVDINELNSKQDELVNAINNVLIENKVNANIIKATSVNITLVDGDNKLKNANPVTITFDKNVSGSYQHFSASNSTLTTNVAIATGISNLAQPDGTFDLSSIYEKIIAVVNDNWTNITQKDSIQNKLVDDINSVVSSYGIKATSVNITLVDGDNKLKNANPVTITFDKKVSGTYTKFNSNGNTLATIDPIQTGISDLAQIDGSFDLSSIQDDIYSKITEVINRNWIDTNQEITKEEALVQSINSIVSPYGINVTNVDITLTDSTSSFFKVAYPVTITFDENVSGSYQYFSASNLTLTTKAPIVTGIGTFKNEQGQVLFPKSVLNELYEFAAEEVSKYWTNPTAPDWYANVKEGLGNNYQKVLDDINSKLKSLVPNFPLSIDEISNYEAYMDVSPDQKLTVNLSFTFVNKEDSNSFDNIIIASNGPELNENILIQQYSAGGKYLVFKNINTALPGIYLDDNYGNKLAQKVNEYVSTNWTTGWDDINQSDLIAKINDVMKTFNSVMAIGLNYWNGNYQTPPSGFDTTYKWVQIGINFENNTPIKVSGDNNPFLSTYGFDGKRFLLVWCKTGVKA